MTETVLVLATGGTIASTDSPAGAAPTRSGSEVLGDLPVESIGAAVDVEEVTQRPSPEMTFETVFAMARRIREVASDIAGVVITHGTDTIEETAYCLDVVLDGSVPVVLTGAQRLPTEPSPDGPANLIGAIRAAAAAPLRSAGGVYLLMNDDLHAARYATKVHTSRPDALASPGAGPVATLTPDGFRFAWPPGSRSVTIPVESVTARVETVTSGLEVDGRAVERAVAEGVDGLVLEAFGLGNTTPGLADAIESAIDAGVAVVVASRCRAGHTAAKYGAASGGTALQAAGAIFAGDLPAHKARIKLLLAASYTDDRAEVRQLFERAPRGV